MRQYIQITLAVLILSSCGQRQDETTETDEATSIDTSTRIGTEYSEEFLEHFQTNEMTLKGNLILFPAEADSAIVLIPEYIPKNQDVKFESENGSSITLRQINYTDIEFEIQYDDQKYSGKASLLPNFYLGMETVGFSDGEYVITHYYVTETDNSCLDFIGLGNQDITKENPENVYALVSVSGDTCEDELNKLKNKKLKTVANRVNGTIR